MGTADIARKNWQAIRLAGNSTLVAVGSRDAAKAGRYIAECQAQSPFPTPPVGVTYDDLLARSDIDAVYVPLPTGIRKDWVVRAANAGKHVLCEKPCGATADDLRPMIEACRANGVQFMDGVMFMHGGRLPAMRAVLDDGESVGEIRRVTSQFSFAAPDDFVRGNIRTSGQLEPLGCLGDLGWYNIRISLWAMGDRLPVSAIGRLLGEYDRDGSPVPMEFAGELQYPGGVSAGFFCSFRAELHQWATVSGTKGSLRIDDFVLPYFGCESEFMIDKPTFDVAGTQYHMARHTERRAVREYSDGHPDSQETRMIRRFSELAKAAAPDPYWPGIALKTQLVLDACLASARNDGRPMPVPTA